MQPDDVLSNEELLRQIELLRKATDAIDEYFRLLSVANHAILQCDDVLLDSPWKANNDLRRRLSNKLYDYQKELKARLGIVPSPDDIPF